MKAGSLDGAMSTKFNDSVFHAKSEITMIRGCSAFSHDNIGQTFNSQCIYQANVVDYVRRCTLMPTNILELAAGKQPLAWYWQ